MGCSVSLCQPPSNFEVPQLDSDMFVIQGLIGEGGFGKVLSATFMQTGKWYAVKEINKVSLLKHKSGLSMIMGELEALKRVDKHPFIVSLHLAYHDRRNCYFVLDLVTGGDLRYYLRRKHIFEEQDVAFYVACISSALEHIHSRNMIHRDIKPENIILDERGYPHLADFGVAHSQTPKDVRSNDAVEAELENSLTSTLASGTKQYLAPEVFCKAHVHGPESDYWSLAVVAYELLHGKRPFEKHCSIQFIQYLERGFNMKRKQLRSTKMREPSFASPTASSDKRAATGRMSQSQSLSHLLPLSSSLTPSSSPSGRPSRSNSGHTSRESIPIFPIMPGAGEDLSHVSYCSSANVSQLRTSWSLRSALFGETSRGPSRTGTDENTSEETTGLSPLPSPHPSPPSSPARPLPSGTEIASPTSVKKPAGIAAADFEQESAGSPGRDKVVKGFPKLWSAPSSPERPPSSAKFSSLPLRPALPPAGAGSANSLKAKAKEEEALLQLPSVSNTNSTSTTSASNTSTQPTMDFDVNQRLPAGDHWLVDQEQQLPKDLRVFIPSTNPWLGKLSNECVAFLAGLFEVRPSHRLGHSSEQIRSHPWLQMHELGDWAGLHKRAYVPGFKPGKQFIKEMLGDRADQLLGCNLLEPGDMESFDDEALTQSMRLDRVQEELLSLQQNLVFNGFKYTAPIFEGFFN